MPAKSVFKTWRAQSLAVAGVMGLVLLCATGLAYVQAGSGPGYLNNPTDRVHKLAQSNPGHAPVGILFDLPKGWNVPQESPGGLVLVDPDRPARRLSLVTIGLKEQATPAQMIYRFVQLHPDRSVRATLRPEAEPHGFTLADVGLSGAQFIGTSRDDQGRVRQHLFACLTPDGRQYWLIYLTDTVNPGEDAAESLRANARLLQAVYRSARVSED